MKPLPSEALEEDCDFCEVKAGQDCLAWCDCRACTEHRDHEEAQEGLLPEVP